LRCIETDFIDHIAVLNVYFGEAIDERDSHKRDMAFADKIVSASTALAVNGSHLFTAPGGSILTE
jgi:hypothetical protein